MANNYMTNLNNFEKSLHELKDLVQQLEHDELSLETSIKKFAKGMGVAKKCQELLNHAEQQIITLTVNTDIDNDKP